MPEDILPKAGNNWGKYIHYNNDYMIVAYDFFKEDL
jgi:hypothetical protein